MIKLFDDEAKNKKWKDRLILGFFIIAAIIIWLFTLPSPPYQESINKYSEMSLPELKRDASFMYDMTYIARNPDSRIGELISFNGKILQVQQNANNYVLRVSTGSGIAEGTQDVWVNYKLKTGNDRPLEGDHVDVCGVFTGLKTYTTVLGASKTIPEVTAFFI